MKDVLALIIVNGLFGAVGAIGLVTLGYLTPSPPTWQQALAAVGPAMLVGAALVIPSAIICLVVAIPVTFLTIVLISIAWGGLLAALHGYVRRRRPVTEVAEDATARRNETSAAAAGGSASATALRVVLAVVALYAVLGASALARAPTRGDDARIWSLRGLTLSYYDFLKPEIFLNPIQAGGHSVYPLFQPLLEATLARAAGHPALRVIHAELWIVFVSLCGPRVTCCGSDPTEASA